MTRGGRAGHHIGEQGGGEFSSHLVQDPDTVPSLGH